MNPEIVSTLLQHGNFIQEGAYYVNHETKIAFSIAELFPEESPIPPPTKEAEQNVKGNSFKEWLESKDGKDCMKPDDFSTQNKLQYLENRLWWAYTAGQGSVLQHTGIATKGTEAERGPTIHHTDGAVLSNQSAEQRAEELYPCPDNDFTTHMAIKQVERAAYIKGHQEASTGQEGGGKDVVQLAMDFVESMSEQSELNRKPIHFNEQNLVRWLSDFGRLLVTNTVSSTPSHTVEDDWIRGEDQPYPLKDVLQLLVAGTEKLLHRKDYDGPDYEEMNIAVQRGKEIAERLNSPTPTTDKVEEEIKRHSDTWKAALEWIDPRTREHNPDKKTYLEQLENKLRSK